MTPSFIDSLREPQNSSGPLLSTRPYPFYLATSLQEAPRETMNLARYAIEWKWDGIRAQLVRRGSLMALWSRGEELISESFPEIIRAARDLPEDCVLDGELLLQKDGKILSFAELQKRISRKKLSEKMLASHPAIFLAFDCLERSAIDLRAAPQSLRREQLETLLRNQHESFPVSPLLQAQTWEEAGRLREEAEARGGEGLMLKSWDGPYKQGRKRGDWWKWKVDPMTLDSVLIYAQAGHGRRATLFTDYTFALWKDGALVPFAKTLQKPCSDLGLHLRVETRTGDTKAAQKRQQKLMLPEILITTPESLALLLTQDNAAALFRELRGIVIDEWHELLSSKRGSLLELSLSRLRNLCPRVQTWALSATLPNHEEAAQAACGVGAQPLLITGLPTRTIQMETLLPRSEDRLPGAGHIGLRLLPEVAAYLDPAYSTLIFTNTRCPGGKHRRSEFHPGDGSDHFLSASPGIHSSGLL